MTAQQLILLYEKAGDQWRRMGEASPFKSVAILADWHAQACYDKADEIRARLIQWEQATIESHAE